ncbi:MAG: hypothetical protein A2041_14575 [Bacteroidetes bacterium GWA2_31_9b]|nr:MAG: hypothetical protein A2041_14575 [Bacteroidetes bacterium GWA2_31_9b]
MKTKLFLAVAIILIVFLYTAKIFAQVSVNECKVLLNEISGSYDGSCKDGLAHGKGIAKGIDTYEGKFKNGLPDGKGKYIWANGDFFDGYFKVGKKNGEGILYTNTGKNKLRGIWKDDEFIKEIEEPLYQILQTQSVTSVSILEKQGGISNTIELVFNRNGQEMRYINTLMLSSSTGSSKESQSFSGFENAFFPFEGTVEFVAMNKLNTVSIRYKVKFRINKEGSWKVIIKY